MKLGMQLGYDDPIGSVAMAQEADRLGFHSVWTSEAWGADAVTVASWIAATTEQIADAVLVAARSEETGQAWVCQPGREPLPFKFPNVPGPRVEGAEGMVPQL